MYFPNLDELSFRVVLAFPMASMTGEEARTRFSIVVSVALPPTMAKYFMAYFALTVLPAPDSPDTMIDWFRFSLKLTDVENNLDYNCQKAEWKKGKQRKVNSKSLELGW